MAINLRNRWLKVVLFGVSLVPFLHLTYGILTDNSGPNPVETITHGTGLWSLRFLLITLTVTPLRHILNLPELTRFRRMTGLFSFFYAVTHMLIWLALDKAFDSREMWADVLKRRYITAGMTALAVMLPLAITSTSGWVRRLGWKRWRKLHRLVYVSAVAAVVHFYWLVKSDVREPLFYAGMLGLLLLFRLVLRFRGSSTATRA